MFRYLTKLKGLIIDVDSFDDFNILSWNTLRKEYKCLFLTFSSDTEREIKTGSDAIVCLMESYLRHFATNKKIHDTALNKLDLKTSEVAYVSENFYFLCNASCFFSGTIWITDNVNYEEASKAPDMICRNIEELARLLKSDTTGFYGENVICPYEENKGLIMFVNFDMDGSTVPLYVLGRYFGKQHYMYQLHPYSSAIYCNKKGKASGEFDDEFSMIYYQTIMESNKDIHIDCVCSVPDSPECVNKFNNILNKISNECQIEDISANFIRLRSYPEQKSVPGNEREGNVKNAFEYKGDLSGKTVVIIDDIMTTGATMRECIRELKKKGANQVIAVALAVNQTNGNYWSYNKPYVKCPKCGEKMFLLVNSYNRQFFFSCLNCRKTLDFNKGWASLKEQIDN